MNLPAYDFSAAEAALKCWEWAEYAAVAVVIFGVKGEYIADFTNVWDVRVDEGRKHLVSKTSTLVLIVGLVAELIFLLKSNSLSGQIIAHLNDEAKSFGGNAVQKALALKRMVGA